MINLVGLDIGTGNIVGARFVNETEYAYKSFRNVFLPLEKNPIVNKMLKQTNVPTAEIDGHIYALGNEALQLASAFHKDLHRPMQRGVLNPHEAQALPIIRAIIQEAVGKPEADRNIVVFSVPADPVDASFNAVYHSGVFEKLLKDLGYEPHTLNEGLAVIYSELLDQNLSGIGLSFGAGMCNVCCAVYGLPVFSFSVATSGDFIDTNTAEALAISQVKALKIKEGIKDLRSPENGQEEAVMFYYKHMMKHIADNIKKHMEALDKLPEFEAPPMVAIAGGTSIPKGFEELFEAALNEAGLPIQLGKVVKSEEPLKAIAKGCLFAAAQLEAEE